MKQLDKSWGRENVEEEVSRIAERMERGDTRKEEKREEEGMRTEWKTVQKSKSFRNMGNVIEKNRSAKKPVNRAGGSEDGTATDHTWCSKAKVSEQVSTVQKQRSASLEYAPISKPRAETSSRP